MQSLAYLDALKAGTWLYRT